jgi:hypothetical protein
MLPTIEELLTEKERTDLVKSIIQLQRVEKYTDPSDLLVQIERWGAWLINGAGWLHFSYSTPADRTKGEIITTALAADMYKVYAICRNAVPYVLRGTKPERWTEAEAENIDDIRARIKTKKIDMGIGAKTYEEADVEKAEDAKRRARKAIQRTRVPLVNHEREMAKRLKTEPAARLGLARELQGTIRGMPETASSILCPACNRRSVWFFIEPEGKTSASCNHQNSCGWWGSLYDLARAV